MTIKLTSHSPISSPATELYLWGYPLVAISRTRLLLCSRTPSATINHINDLATPHDRAIVVPNNDTLYSSAWYDLSLGDLTIDVPAMDHARRYWNLMIVDAYGHVGYVCRRHHGTAGTQVRITLDPSTQPSNDSSRVVRIGTPTAWIIMRVLVEAPSDMERARTLQQAFRIIAPSNHSKTLTQRAGRATDIGKSGADFFTELQTYLAIDPPAAWHPKLSLPARRILQNLSSVPTKILEEGVVAGENVLNARDFSDNVVENGWSTGRDATGFGSNIIKRAAGARYGLGGHQAIENRSYTALHDAKKCPLDGEHPLRLRFEANSFPPCDAFWSLTAYGRDMYLVENEIDRWSISDRTPGLVYADDDSLTIYLSAEPPEDTSNWLPVPKGPYLLGMRVYEGHTEVVNCEWFPPVLTD